MIKPDLNTKRMPYVTDPYWDSVNTLHGLDELCSEYLNKSKIVLELGTYVGVSTQLFAYYAKHVTTIDITKQSTIDQILKLHDNVSFICGDTKELLPQLNKKYDFIYIDADHAYEGVKRDIQNSISLLLPNGVVAGHDYDSNTKNDVFRAVNELFTNIKVYSDQSWVALQ